MIHYTYVLLCTKKNNQENFYIGSTSNLKQRLKKHQSKSNQSTKFYSKIQLIYYEACKNKTDALRRENQLKTGFGRGYLKNRLKSYFTLRD